MKKTLKFLFNLSLLVVLTFAVSMYFGFEKTGTAVTFGALTGLSVAMSYVGPIGGYAFSGLVPEIWTDQLMENIMENDAILNEMVNMDEFVTYGVINLAEAGIEPTVLENNTTYPITAVERTDGALALPLMRFDTENTVIRRAEEKQLSYNKRESVIRGHRNALVKRMVKRALHAIAPATNATGRPLLVATGADNGYGFKRLTFDDIIQAEARCNDDGIDPNDRNLVLSSQHRADLLKEDKTLYNQMLKDGTLYGFKLHTKTPKSLLPSYNGTTGAKIAFGATVLAAHTTASVFWTKNEVMRCKEDAELFLTERDAAARGDIMGFQMNYLSMPIRNFGIGAIYSPAV